MFSKSKSGSKSIRQLTTAFSIVAVLLFIMGLNAINEVNKLASLTDKMYHHPFVVSNSVLKANASIIAMHRHMKDVVLAKNKEELNDALYEVGREEANVFEQFEIVMGRFLGDKSKIQNVRQVFVDWKKIRNEVVQLTLREKTLQAAAITKGKGAEYVVLLMSKMDELIEFASNKADEFHKDSQRAYSESVLKMSILMALLLFLNGAISVFVIRRVKKWQNTLERSEKKFRDLFNTMANGVVYQDIKRNIILANKSAVDILGLKEDYKNDKNTWDKKWKINGIEDSLEICHPVVEAIQSNKKIRSVVMFTTEQESNLKRWILVNSTPMFRLNSDSPYQVCSTFSDITELKQAEYQLRKLSRAVEQSSSAVIITDKSGIIEYVNPKFTIISGYSAEEVIGQTPSILKSGETPESRYSELWESITKGREWKGEFHNRKKNGTYYWAHDSISAVKNESGEISHFIGIQEDITNQYEMSEKLSYQASHDILTGLINRYEFERRTEILITALFEADDEHALCYMDLDQFKIINDTCGHAAGDELLRQLGREMRNVIRKQDTLSRLGGDEFGLLLEHCSLKQARHIAETILRKIQNYHFTWDKKIFKVGISIGLVAINKDFSNLTELMQWADAACYMAKDSGRNRIHVYHPEDKELALRHGQMQWVSRIDRALEENRFRIYAQTIKPLDGSGSKHYELLIRLLDSDGKIIPPSAFLPAAERFDLMEKIDKWVISEAFNLLQSYPGFLNMIHFISINLSGPSLSNLKLYDHIIELFEESKIEPAKICFEVTETVAISNMDSAINFITKLKLIGCQFALDDFGSGLSSFGYLKNIPVDYLKIDGVFVKDMASDHIEYAIVKSINDLGHVMGKKTIAEFVENDEIENMLRMLGVDYAQGYGIEEPQPLENILEKYSRDLTIIYEN